MTPTDAREQQTTMISDTTASRPTSMETSDLHGAFEKHLAEQSGTPDWWIDMKRKAFAEYGELPMPTRKNEQWRFSSLRGLDLSGYHFGDLPSPAAGNPALSEQSVFIHERAGRMVFADNQLVSHEAVSAELADKGVIWVPISEALQKHRELLQEYFMAQEPHLGSEKFAALHSAFVSTGSLLYVPAGVEVKLPFVARHWAVTEGAAIFPHTLVIAGDNARVTLVDIFNSTATATRNFSCGFNHLFAGNGSHIEYYSLQNWSLGALAFQINSLIADRDAEINSLAVNIGGSHFRSESNSIMRGAGSNVEMLSLSVADREQEIDQRTLQTHLAPNTRSNLLFKNALMDNSRTIFSGLIRVAEDAQKTDAYQTNRNLLISDTAEANSLPGLEIGANDVKCSHGATTAQIDDTELFYMLARGIKPHVARELLVFGFFEEVISHLDNEELAEG
ncbi:MAG: Fe-S cluster assembly protein SufD, partial [Verrucomicrobia bacterium]